MESHISYSERMKERKRIISEIDTIKEEITNCDYKINTIKREIEELKKKIKNFEKELSYYQSEKQKLENKKRDHKANYLMYINPVGECEGHEVENGLLGMKRDINMKVTDYLSDAEIRQV
jgi:chromosome segregation ATPase